MINVDKFVYGDGDVLEFIVLKHGSHNQSTHGNWATGGEGQKITGLINKLYEKKTPGFSINIKSRRTPKTGYMCSEKGFEKTISVEDFYKTRDGARKYLVEYMQKNSEALSKRGAYFGAWVDGGKVYLDVSRRYESRQAGVDAGVSNEQQAIYDIKNDSFIYIGGNDGEANKAVADRSSESSESDDGRGIVRIRRRDSERDGQLEDDDFNPLEDETLTVHISNGRTLGIKPGEFVTKKHEQHDQSSHGNWASFGGDSSILARNGAKEYSEQNNIKQDTSITYKDVVANRARASRIADAYDKLPDFDKEAVDEFESLGREVNKQYDFMTRKLGVKVEFVSKDPYKTSKEMFADVSKKRLKVLSTESTGGHPVFTDEQNDRFRAVHDFFGHAATGRGFGQDGEEAAWVHHSQMFTPKARLALTTETRGQNSWYNTRKNGFAKQKVALLPSEFVVVPEIFEKHGTHDQSSHAGSRRRIGSDTTETEPRRQQGEQEITDPNAPKPKLKPGRKPDPSGTLEERAEKLANGERIQVTKKEAKKIMKIMAKREDNPDLTNMHIEDTQLYDEDNLGIPRNQMPQVPSDTKAVFISEMEKRGARVQRGVADPSKLHPIQAEMSASKVGLIMKSLRKKGMKTDDGGRIIISKDNYVIDGHHRWAAAAMLSFEDSSVKLPVIRVDMNHKDLIDATLAWNEATGIKPIGMGESNKPGQMRKAWAEFDYIIAKAIRGRTIVRFQPGLKPRIEKHLAGGHDQTTHGRWADSGLPHQLANVEESLDFLFDEGLIRPGEIPLKYKYESNYTSTDNFGMTRTETRVLTDGVANGLEGGVRMWNIDLLKEKAKEQGMSKELENKIDSMLEKKMLSGDKESIEIAAREEGIKLGLKDRQLQYYMNAIGERAQVLATTNNDLVRYEIIKMLVNENLIPKDMNGLSPKFIKQFERTVETMKQSLDKGFPVVAIEADDMLKVIGDGRFKTQHETRESNGAYKPYLRRQRELALAGVPLDTKASERPIYGYVATQERGSTPNTSDYNQDRYNINNGDVGQYGNVRVVLKDNVKQRTSYTIPDSLDGYALARPLTEKHTFKTLSQAGVHHDLSLSHGGKEREGYVEAQIYRGVKVSDIKKIYVMEEKKGRADTKSIKQIKDALAEKNLTIPVESLEYENA